MLSAFLTISTLQAQYKIGLVPRTSPDRSVYQQVGYTEVEVTYGSPSANGREIWGKLVPYDQVWRAGANNATTIRFSDDVVLAGEPLAAGTYAVFVIARALQPWTIIFNKKAEQWGAFRYNAEEDALRMDVFPFETDHCEQLAYTITNVGFDYGQVQLNWGTKAIRFTFKTDYLDRFKARVDSMALGELPGSWISWLQGAEYLANTQQELPLALAWLDRAATTAANQPEWHDQYYPRHYVQGHWHWIRARVLASLERYEEALAEVALLQVITDDYNFYEKKREREQMDLKIQTWSRLAN